MAVLLIAEDEKDMQNIIVDFMQQGGHSCILANDGVEALSILENNTVDLIILDIMMPRLFPVPERLSHERAIPIRLSVGADSG